MLQQHLAETKPLKIALLTYAYLPSVGGIENVSELVANGLRARRYEVMIVTHTPTESGANEEKHVVRRPSLLRLLSVIRWADVVVQSNVSLRLAWPLSLGVLHRPWVVVNHTPISRPSGRKTFRDRIKLASLRSADVYAVSEYLRSVTTERSRMIRNPYDVQSFRLPEQKAPPRERELLFVGRIVRAKGLDILIEALHVLHQDGLRVGLTVAGDGPERSVIGARIAELKLQDQVSFLGVVRGEALGQIMRGHKIMVVPSRPEPPEALPLVPIEGIACGCMVIASRQGGLPESVGDCGLLVPPEDPQALAQAIRISVTDETLRESLLAHRAEHIRKFHPNAVLDEYEAAIRKAVGR